MWEIRTVAVGERVEYGTAFFELSRDECTHEVEADDSTDAACGTDDYLYTVSSTGYNHGSEDSVGALSVDLAVV